MNRTRKLWILGGGGKVCLQRREVSDYSTAIGGVLVRTKSGGVYLVAATFEEVHAWIEAKEEAR